MSSTYTIRVVILPLLCLINKVWSELLCLYQKAFIDFKNLPNQALEDYFKPYKDFFSLHTLQTLLGLFLTPGGTSMYTSSSKFLLRKAFFISNWCKGQSLFIAREIRIHTVLIFATGTKVPS